MNLEKIGIENIADVRAKYTHVKANTKGVQSFWRGGVQWFGEPKKIALTEIHDDEKLLAILNETTMLSVELLNEKPNKAKTSTDS